MPTVDMQEILGQPVEDSLNSLKTSTSGLSSHEAKSRLETYGYNELAKRKKRIIIIEFLSHFKSPLTILLMFAGFVSALVGEIRNSAIIFPIVILSVTLDFYQEFKAEKAAEMLKQKVTTSATVIRDGKEREVRIADIVPGDIVRLSAGDVVPADARVISAKDLFLDQSALTGESFPVEKISSPLNGKEAPATEWDNCVFLGSSVVSGMPGPARPISTPTQGSSDPAM